MNEYHKTIKRFAGRLPKFPDGRIDYSESDCAPVVTVFVKYRSKILLLKRSNKVRNYRELWNTVAGFLDEDRPLADKIRQELKEELGLGPDDIKRIEYGRRFELVDEAIAKTWLVFPAVVELMRLPGIRLDWEHSDYRWIEPEALTDYAIVPQLDTSWKNANTGSG